MRLYTFIFFLFILTFNSLFGQNTLNNYKYIVVPRSFDFLRSEDQHQLNSLTKFLFTKEGFETIFDSDRRSEELSQKPCLGLRPKIIDNSSMLSTKLVLVLLNCKSEEVLRSVEGKSKIKDYKRAFHEALRMAFKSVSAENYKYTPTIELVSNESLVDDSSPVVKETIEPIVEDVQKVEETITQEVDKVATDTKEEIPLKVLEKEQDEQPKDQVVKNTPKLLYAQINSLGYQLVDSEPKVVYVLLKSSKENVYFLKNKNGIVYKENNWWFVEYYEEGKLVKEELQIKF